MSIVAVLLFVFILIIMVRHRGGRHRERALDLSSWRPSFVAAVRLAQQHGYHADQGGEAHEVATYYGKKKSIAYLYIDFFVEKDGIHYPVKVHKSRQSNRLDGPFLRDHLLTLWLLYDTPIVYIHVEKSTVNLVDFSIYWPRRTLQKRWIGRIIWLGIGLLIGFLIAHH